MKQQRWKSKQSSINTWLLLDVSEASTEMLSKPKHKSLLDDIHQKGKAGKRIMDENLHSSCSISPCLVRCCAGSEVLRLVAICQCI